MIAERAAEYIALIIRLIPYAAAIDLIIAPLVYIWWTNRKRKRANQCPTP